MDNPSISTSFIPKQSMAAKPVSPTASSRGGMGLFTLISFVLLLLSVLAAGGAFTYKTILQNHLYGKCADQDQLQPNTDSLGFSGEVNRKCGLYLSLDDMRRRLDSDRLSRMERLDTKMKLATEVLQSHMTLIPLFDFLSTSTLKTVRFSKFSTEKGEVSLEGSASGYEDIAVESNILNRMPEVSDALFSDLNIDQKGNVTFKLKFRVDASRLKYVPAIQTN